MADMKVLYSVCEKLSEELSNANKRIEKMDKLNISDIEYLDKLTHAIKSLKTVIAMEEASHDEYSRTGRNNYGNSYDYYDGGNSYARGRTGNVRRDSMGRYSREYSMDDYSREYSRNTEDMVRKMHDLLGMTTDERTKREIQKMLDDMER